MARPRYPQVRTHPRRGLIRRGLRNRQAQAPPPQYDAPMATPQSLAGTTISQSTTQGPSNIRLAPGLAIQYDANGRPLRVVRINQSGPTSSVGIAQGKGLRYDASGKPSLVDFPPQSSTSTPAPAVGSDQMKVVSPGTFGDSFFSEEYKGAFPSLRQGITNRNASDQQYLISMGYTPEQAARAIQSNPYSIVNPDNLDNPSKEDIGTLKPGGLDWNQVDVNNPYSRAGMLVRSYRGAVQGTATGMASGGHGRSGAALTAQQANSSNFGSGQAQWNQDLQNYVAGSTEYRTNLGEGTNTNIRQAMARFLSDPDRNKTSVMTWAGDSNQGIRDASGEGTNLTTVPTTGTYIYGADAAKKAGLIAPTVSLAPGWSVEVKNGKIVRFIPPGGV